MTRFNFPDGATPIDDCSGLIPTWIYTLQDLNRIEAENIMVAQRKFLSGPVRNPLIWFQVKDLRNMHHLMFSQVWDWAGQYRKTQTSIGTKPNLIPLQIGEFVHEVHAWLTGPKELSFVDMAARIHHRLVWIHPFTNGNGRFSRLVADRFLFSFRCPYPMWPILLNSDGILRKDYIQTLKKADSGDYEPLVLLMQQLGAKNPSV